MLTETRHEKIIDLLKEKGAVTVAYLSEKLKTSESTIRRDLISLDELGKLQKVHGGATTFSYGSAAKEEIIKVFNTI